MGAGGSCETGREGTGDGRDGGPLGGGGGALGGALGGETGGGGGGAAGAKEGGGGGGADGVLAVWFPRAVRAAWVAIEGGAPGGGGVGLPGAAGGGGGARDVVGGGADGGGGGGAAGLADGGGGGGADGFRDTGGGGGLIPPGGGGGARGGALSGAELVLREDDGLEPGRGGAFFKLATNGFTAGADGDSEGGGGGGRPPGSRGAPGGLGGAAEGAGREASESDRYGESCLLAPVLTPPPRLRSFGIPPAKRPPSWAAGALADASEADTPSLLLLNLLAAGPDGTGGASPVGGGRMPGTGGAAPTGGPPELPPDFASIGPDRSFVTVFFSRAPLWISDSKAPCLHC